LLEILNNTIKSGPSVSEDSTLFSKLKEVLADEKAKSSDEQLRMDKFYLLVDLVHLMPKKASVEKTETLLSGKQQKRRNAYANDKEPITVEQL